jgi:hypothetical protein
VSRTNSKKPDYLGFVLPAIIVLSIIWWVVR